MLFNSLPFLAWFLSVLLVFHLAPIGWRSRKHVLLLASWGFYATWSPRFLPLLIATTWVDFHLARYIHRLRFTAGRPAGARVALIASVALNLSVLTFFKYGRFLWDSAAALALVPVTPAWLAIVAPLGVSFYTFHSISYVVDTYRGLRPPTDDFADFALYVAFFPQLIAGPITRWGFFGPQLNAAPRVDLQGVERALFLLATGFVKKVVLADAVGGFVDGVYGNPVTAGWVEIVVALYAYAFQIYFDFSGYTDIATGLAGLVGFQLPENFRHPYLAESPSEFWRRWHISLSTWLRDYLYVGLGGNRRGTVRTYANLIVTMLLGGLWHGAAWTFVLWGAYHGVWLALHRMTSRGAAPRTPRWLRRLVTFHLVTLGWVLFRAGSLGLAGDILRGVVRPWAVSGPFPVGAVTVVLLGAATHLLATRTTLATVWGGLPRPAQGAVYGMVIVLVMLFGAQSGRFIYFQF